MFDIYRVMRPGEPATLDSSKNQIITRFFDEFRYDLAKVGRYKFNRKLNVLDRVLGLALAEDIKVNGEVVVDEHGHENSWIYQKSQAEFEVAYPTQLREGVYLPAATPRILLPLVMDVLIPQWGTLESVAAGGWLNITNLDDIYGVSARDIEETHIILGEATEYKLTK